MNKDYYVYLLVDKSKTNGIFYVGRGCGQRAFAHQKCACASHLQQPASTKSKIIQQNPQNLEHVILRSGLTLKEAQELEAATIDLLNSGYVSIACQKLTNIQKGQNSHNKGIRSVDGIIKKHKRWINIPSGCTIISLKVDALSDTIDNIVKNTLWPLKSDWVKYANLVIIEDEEYVLAVYESTWSQDSSGKYNLIGKRQLGHKMLGHRVPKRKQGTKVCRLLSRCDINKVKRAKPNPIIQHTTTP
ncbi:MAG: GIY-YIG nuclease family protein [Bacteroidales bacterium]|nr:GIY-YIG nuclease family protein [Candidatus Equimonas faecalis]